MDTYSLKIHEENIRKVFAEDAIGRNKYIFGIIKWINQISNGAIISLEGDWGSGKTFLLRQLELLYNDKKLIDEWKNRPNNIDFSILNLDDARIIYYDAWKNDGAENPLLNLVYNLAVSEGILVTNNEIKIDFEKIVSFALGKLKYLNPAFEVVDFIRQFIKIENIELFKSVEKENFVNDIIKEFINVIKKKYDDKKIVIIIDELDRCQPSFALRIIESIKHYFEDNGIIVILSINPREMQSIIRKYYGETFDANIYLDKIIDVHLQVPKLNVKCYVKFALKKAVDNNLLYYAMLVVIDKYKLIMRQINRYLGTLKVIFNEDVLCGDRRPNGYWDEEPISFIKKVYLPIYLIGVYYFDNKAFNDLVDGNGKKIFINDFLINKNNLIYFRVTRLAKCTGQQNISDENIEKCKEWLENIYDMYFNSEMNEDDYNTYNIGEDKKLLFNTLNLISLTDKYYY